jgi:hypothetical protein
MGFLDLFGRDKVVGTKVLVCAVGSDFDELADRDAAIYKFYYPATTVARFSGIQELIDSLRQGGYDIVHLFCDVGPAGHLPGSSIQGTDLIESCCSCNVKLLWLASSNSGDKYIEGFRARGKQINLVMTIDRKDEKFSHLLEKLISKISKGLTIPVAWNQLCPQIPGTNHPDAPDSIFFAGRGGVRFQ